MAALVWFTMGVALWHFTVFVPDRFSGGIVGAFLGAGAGAMVSGAIAQIALGKGIGDTDLATALYAVPGALLGLACVRASRPSTSSALGARSLQVGPAPRAFPPVPSGVELKLAGWPRQSQPEPSGPTLTTTGRFGA